MDIRDRAIALLQGWEAGAMEALNSTHTVRCKQCDNALLGDGGEVVIICLRCVMKNAKLDCLYRVGSRVLCAICMARDQIKNRIGAVPTKYEHRVACDCCGFEPKEAPGA